MSETTAPIAAPLGTYTPQQRIAGYAEIEKQAYQGLLGNASATLYTAPSAPTLGPAPKARMVEVLLANTDSSARTVTLYVVASGGSVGDSNTILPAVSLSANSFNRLKFATVIEAGGTIRGFADTANKVCATIAVVELLPRQA